MSQYFRFDSDHNDFYTFTEDEEKGRLERVHLAGHYRYHFTCYGRDAMERYSFRGSKWNEQYLENLFDFESDEIDDMYQQLFEFVMAVERVFPVLLYDNIESYKFFGNGKDKKRDKITIDDHVNNSRVTLEWDDILKYYHLMRLFGLNDQDDNNLNS